MFPLRRLLQAERECHEEGERQTDRPAVVPYGIGVVFQGLLKMSGSAADLLFFLALHFCKRSKIIGIVLVLFLLLISIISIKVEVLSDWKYPLPYVYGLCFHRLDSLMYDMSFMFSKKWCAVLIQTFDPSCRMLLTCT